MVTVSNANLSYSEPRRQSLPGCPNGEPVGRTPQTTWFGQLSQSKRARGTNAAAGAPTPASIFHGLRGLPFPGPLKLHGRTSASGVLAHELDERIFMQIWVGMEFSRH